MKREWWPDGEGIVDYDDFPYDDFPFPEAHPERLFAVGRLFGLDAQSPECCRVLELGCGQGGHLLPLAAALPKSSFLGIDLSSLQIEMGQERAQAAGLQNLEFQALDLRKLSDLSPFDYIICHVVYSWVSPEVQRAILRICRAFLKRDGVAYLSYNTLPGWHARGLIRARLRREMRSGSPQEQIKAARRTLAHWSLVDRLSDPLQRWLSQELKILEKLSDAYLYYEHLTPINEPLYLPDLLARAQRVGLQYLGDAQLESIFSQRLGPEIHAEAERFSDLISMEAWMDQISLRCFRRSLLCHRERSLKRHLEPGRIMDLYVETQLRLGEEPQQFLNEEGGSLKVAAPQLAEVLKRLIQGGGPTRLSDLGSESAVGGLLEVLAYGQLPLWGWRPPYRLEPGLTPKATSSAQLQAQRDEKASNLRHRSIQLDRADRLILGHLDGSRDREQLLKILEEALKDGWLKIEAEGRLVDRALLKELLELKLKELAQKAFILE